MTANSNGVKTQVRMGMDMASMTMTVKSGNSVCYSIVASGLLGNVMTIVVENSSGTTVATIAENTTTKPRDGHLPRRNAHRRRRHLRQRFRVASGTAACPPARTAPPVSAPSSPHNSTGPKVRAASGTRGISRTARARL